MERPKTTREPIERPITGEIVYLNAMRKRGEYPKPYSELSQVSTDLYENVAAMYTRGRVHPEIIDEYAEYDDLMSDTERSCIALADELLALKAKNSQFNFVDIAVDVEADRVLERLKLLKAGQALADDDTQLAIESDGSHYPILDVKKKNMELSGVWLRVWGWEYPRVIITNAPDEPYNHNKHVLQFPSNEKQVVREFELIFSYAHPNTTVGESVSLWVDSNGRSNLSSRLSMSEYAETGYEGHGGMVVEDVTDDDIAAFGDLVAEIVGDHPESVGGQMERQWQQLLDDAATPEMRAAMTELLDATWTAQALFLLTHKWDGMESIDTLIKDPERTDEVVTTIHDIIKRLRV